MIDLFLLVSKDIHSQRLEIHSTSILIMFQDINVFFSSNNSKIYLWKSLDLFIFLLHRPSVWNQSYLMVNDWSKMEHVFYKTV